MILAVKDIQFLLELLAEEIVVERSDAFPYRVTKRGFGYSADQTRGQLQAKLSIMLEMASKSRA